MLKCDNFFVVRRVLLLQHRHPPKPQLRQQGEQHSDMAAHCDSFRIRLFSVQTLPDI